MINSIYLAGPVDLGGDIKWKELLQEKLRTADTNISLFDPANSFKVTGAFTYDSAQYIEEVNNAAIDAADLVICSLPAGIQTVGTIIEIDKAYRDGKDIWLLTNLDVHLSAYLLNRIDISRVFKYNLKKLLTPATNDGIDDALDSIVARIVAIGTRE